MKNFNNLSKKIKLPKNFWEKGKSKFLHIRLIEDGLFNLNSIVKKFDFQYYRNKHVLRMQENKFFKKIFLKIKQYFCKHKFNTEETTMGLILHCPKCDYNKILWKR